MSKYIESALQAVGKAGEAVYLSTRPLPKAPDGLSDAQAAPAVLNKAQDHSVLFNAMQEIIDATKRGLPIEPSLSTLSAAIDAVKNSKTVGLDDRKNALELVLVLLSRLKKKTPLSQKLQDAVISLLYEDLQHPPSTYLGRKYVYREADGSGNNVNVPNMGKAGTPYARTVQSTNPVPMSCLPDPELVFDALLKREEVVDHPSGISSLFFSFANLVIHSLFKTDPNDVNINLTSSYLDLSPLYGDNLEAQESVRKLDGTGLLHPDTFADARVKLNPPAVGALLIVFARNHNYIATKILQINERRTYKNPPPSDPSERRAQDDDIFNKARSVNCGHFMNVILSDYLSAILALTKDGSDWTLNPLETIRESGHEFVARGEGNAVSVEFNLLYRWHATLSVPDEEWVQQMFGRMFPDKPFNQVNVKDWQQRVKALSGRTGDALKNTTVAKHVGYGGGVGAGGSAVLMGEGHIMDPVENEAYSGHTQELSTASTVVEQASSSTNGSLKSTQASSDPKTWTFGGMIRGEDGKFDDDDLANHIHNATHTVASAFKARGTPEVMKIVEMLGIEQAREWGVCTLNEFRKQIGLKQYESFEEWNPREDIANAAQALYGHIDNLELYAGMQAEQAKPPGDGAGLCPGYTISRAILADAVSLTRGDRFLTTDFTPYNLTAWGFQDCARDNTNGAFGGGLSKLLFRALPHNYRYNSVYGLFPFHTPKRMMSILNDLAERPGHSDLDVSRYDFRKPHAVEDMTTVKTAEGVVTVLGDPRRFKTTYQETIGALTNGHGFMLAYDDKARHDRDLKMMRDALMPDQNSIPKYASYYRNKSSQLIREKSFSLSGQGSKAVDIVRDVINLVPTHFVSTQLAGIPIKTRETPKGLHTEQEVYQYLALIFTYIFLNVEPANGWVLRSGSEKVAKLLEGYIKGHLDSLRHTGLLAPVWNIKDTLSHWLVGTSEESHSFLSRLAASGRPTDELSYNVMSIIVAATANFAQATALVVNFYLEEARASERADIIDLVKLETPAASQRLAGYVREAMRLDPQAPGVFRDAAEDVEVIEGRGKSPVKIHKNQRIFVSLHHANRDPTLFGPDPEKVDPTRPRANYKTFGSGMHTCLGNHFTEAMMPEVLRSIFSLKNVRRAPGQSGILNRFVQDLHGTPQHMYINAKGTVTPWPATMVLQYDA